MDLARALFAKLCQSNFVFVLQRLRAKILQLEFSRRSRRSSAAAKMCDTPSKQCEIRSFNQAFSQGLFTSSACSKVPLDAILSAAIIDVLVYHLQVSSAILDACLTQDPHSKVWLTAALQLEACMRKEEQRLSFHEPPLAISIHSTNSTQGY